MKKILIILFCCGLVIISFNSISYSSGPGGGYTNAPNEANCTSCHSGTLNRGSFASAFELTGDFTGGGYLPDSTYKITIKHAQSGVTRYGFQVTVLDKSNKSAGDLTRTSNRTQKRTKVVNGNTRQYIEHTSTGTSKTGTNKVDWTFEWEAPSSNIGDVTFYAALNAANGSGTGGDSIYAKKFIIKPSSLLPQAQIVTSDTNICALSVASFTAGGTGSPTSYEWTFAGGSPSVSTKKDPKVNYNRAGTYLARLRVTSSKGRSDWDTVEIKVNQAPSAFISGGNRAICKGDSVKLSVGAISGHKYLWNNKEITSSIWVKEPGKYYVIVTSPLGCNRVSNEITVSYRGVPSTNLTSSLSNDSTCAGSLVSLNASQGYDSFAWYKNDQFVAGTDTNIYQFNLSQSGKFKLKVQDANGCWSEFSDTLDLTAVERLSAPKMKCKEKTPNSVTWEWEPVPQYQGFQVSNDGQVWNDPSSGSFNRTHLRQSLSPDTDYKLYVRAKDAAPCFYSPVSSLVCRTGTCDSITVQLDYKSDVCKGEDVEVKVQGLNGQKFALYFENGDAFTDSVFQFTPQISKKYALELEDSTNLGCPPAQYFIDVTVHEIEQLRLETQKPTNTFCTYDTVRFNASSGNDIYRFFVNGQLRMTSSDSFYYENTFQDGDSAFVDVEKGACKARSEQIYLNVVPNPDASFNFTRSGSIYDFNPSITNYQKYFWEFGDGFTSVLMQPTHDYKSSAGKSVSVSLNVTDNSNCLNDTTQLIELPDFTGVEELLHAGLKVYPSPVTDRLNIESSTNSAFCVEIISLNARVLKYECAEFGKLIVDTQDLVSGLYIVRIKDEAGGSYDWKLMKE